MTSGTPAVTYRPEAPGPRHLQIEITAACNLACEMCLVAYRPKRKVATATVGRDDFERIVEDLSPRLERITLQGLGEPLLVPHLEDMVAFAAARGIRVGFNSNGMLLSRSRAQRLISAGLAWLHVSVDGATPETHRAIRGPAVDHRRVVRNVSELIAVRAGRPGPRVEIVFVAMRRNIGELADLVVLAAALGVDRLRVQNLSHDYSDTDPGGDYAGIRAFSSREALFNDPGWRDRALDSFARARSTATGSGFDLRLPEVDTAPPPRRPGEPGCTWPWDGVYVNHDGVVQPCCMLMGSDRGRLGSTADRPVSAIWNGHRYRRFRAALLSERPPAVCAGCSLYGGIF